MSRVARVLLLGSTGFVGRAVAHKMLDAGHQLRVLVRDPMKAAAYKVRGAQVVVGSAMDAAALAAAAQGTEHIVSLVAVRRNKPQSMFEINADGPRLVGEAAKRAGSQSVIFVSAIGARLDQKYKYLTSRWMGEQELAKTGVAGAILRFSFVLGEDGGILHDFERAANFGPFLIIPGDGKTQVQPILRDDAARCVVEAIGKTDLLGKIIELGGPEVVTYETMFNWFIQARGIKKPKLHMIPALLKPGAFMLELMTDDPVATPDEINTIQIDNVADGLDSVTAHFGWRPSAPSQWAPAHWQIKRR
jgi:NADH dehydrogenase